MVSGTKINNRKSTFLWKHGIKLQDLPQIFETRDHLEALRAHKIAEEFGQKYIIKGSGTEYRRIEAMKASGQAFILPLNFPDAFDVENPYDALIVSLAQLKHWELAPENPARMVEGGIDIALTSNGLSKPDNFLKMVRIAVERGLAPEDALKALTYTPAQLLGVYQTTGSLEPGKLANFFITDGEHFQRTKPKYYTIGPRANPTFSRHLSPALC
jgi:imidazolonepropionase-like amidohydrolase